LRSGNESNRSSPIGHVSERDGWLEVWCVSRMLDECRPAEHAKMMAEERRSLV
jgi:hypothetical protein